MSMTTSFPTFTRNHQSTCNYQSTRNYELQQKSIEIVAAAIKKASALSISDGMSGNHIINVNILAEFNKEPITIVLHTFCIHDSNVMRAEDRNHVASIINQFKMQCYNAGITLENNHIEDTTWNENHYQNLLQTIQNHIKEQRDQKAVHKKTNKKHILIGVGELGLRLMQQLFREHPLLASQMITVWQGNEYPIEIKSLVNKLNIIGLPKLSLKTAETFVTGILKYIEK